MLALRSATRAIAHGAVKPRRNARTLRSSDMTRTLTFYDKRFKSHSAPSPDKAPNKPAAFTVKGKTGMWEIVLGLEIHAQIVANTKLFSDAPTNFAMAPNTQVSVVDAALPGTLPVVNSFCVEQAIKTGLAIQGKINLWSAFDRKHYFYADLPMGYQITQYYTPIVSGGHIQINLPDYTTKSVAIERIQLETDSGKSIHDLHPTQTHVDLNRAGSALMEIVTYPDMNSPTEAVLFVKKVQHLLKLLGTCDGNMAEGNLRVDVNVSVRRANTSELGTRCELKNLNSLKALKQAIEFEAKRQVDVIESGDRVVQETRFYDPESKGTVSGRKKEDELDYRYFPEPDLPPLTVDAAFVDELVNKLPVLPDTMQARLRDEYKLSAYEADVLVNHLGAYEYFKEVVEGGRDAQDTAKWVVNDIFGFMNEKNLDFTNSPLTSAQLGQLMDLITTGKISGRIAKDVIELKFEENDKRDPAVIVKEKDWYQMQDMTELEALCKRIIAQCPKEVLEYKEGKDRRMKHFVGMAMKETKGKAPGPVVTEMFHKLIVG